MRGEEIIKVVIERVKAELNKSKERFGGRVDAGTGGTRGEPC